MRKKEKKEKFFSSKAMLPGGYPAGGLTDGMRCKNTG